MSNIDYTMNEIIHNSPFPGGNASEYISPKGRIDITSHGMGSGIYGLSREYLLYNPANSNHLNYVFTIENPYVITTDDNCGKYISASKHVMRIFQYYVDSGQYEISKYEFRKISKEFIDIIDDKGFDIIRVAKSLETFWIDYNTRTDFIEMPINYILKGEGMDGVMSLYTVYCHSWSKGDVKFIPYPTYTIGDKIPVAIILSRKGIDKPQTDLRKLGYVLEKNYWIKNPPRTEIFCCRYCNSTEHKALFCPYKKFPNL